MLQFTAHTRHLCRNSHSLGTQSAQAFTQSVHTIRAAIQFVHTICAIHTVHAIRAAIHTACARNRAAIHTVHACDPCNSQSVKALCAAIQFVHAVLAAIHTACARDLCSNSAHVHGHLVCSAHRPWAGTPRSSLIHKKATQLQGGRRVCLHTLLGLSAPTVDSRGHHMPGLQGGPHSLLQ